jgi:hypothetical protein
MRTRVVSVALLVLVALAMGVGPAAADHEALPTDDIGYEDEWYDPAYDAEIVRAHGVTVAIDDSELAGAKFSVRMPGRATG